MILRDRVTGNMAEWTRRILPVVLPGRSVSEIPDFLAPNSVTRYKINEITVEGIFSSSLLSALYGKAAHPAPPLGRYEGGGALPRVVAADRESLRPQTLDPVARSPLLDAALALRKRHERTGGTRQVLALIGEGGIGKSVLLGQLLDRLEADQDAGGVVLVSAASVVPSGSLDGRTATDLALGMAAHDTLGQAGLTALLRTLRDRHGRATVLLDTLDLLLDHHRLPALAAVLAEALEIGNVVVTCRLQEFGSHLREVAAGAPRLAGRITGYELPLLNQPEIVEWARDHLADRGGETEDHEAFLLSLEGGVATKGSLRKVCALPVRLALTCRVFGELGRVPEDLTITGLYRSYWDVRVRRHLGGAGSPDGDRKERAALHVARQVITGDGSIRLRVPRGLLDPDDLAGLRLLSSEGVLRELGSSWEFFHQTFAEYAHGRWLLGQGVDSPEVAELASRLRDDRASLWPLARTLLLQAESYEDYRDLAGVLPAGSAEGAHAQVLGALQRAETAALEAVLGRLADRPVLLRAVEPALGDVPLRHRLAVFSTMLAVLRDHAETVGDLAVGVLVSVLSRSAPADWLRQAVVAVLERRRALGEAAWDSYIERLVQQFATPPVDGGVLDVGCELYTRFGPLGRRAVLRVHLATTPSEERVAAIAAVALAGRCPPLPDDELVAFMTVLWESSPVRAGRGWSDWRDLLADQLPLEWNNGQIKLVVRLVDRDPSLAEEIVDDVLATRIRSPEPHVAVLAQISVTRASWVADRMLAAELPHNPAALNGIAKCMPAIAAGVPAAVRADLAQWLEPAKALAPRAVWRTLAVLAADDLGQHRALMDSAAAADLTPATRDALVTTWIGRAPRPVLDGLLDDLRGMTATTDSETLELRARLEGRVVNTDPSARDWVSAQVLTGASPKVAGTAIKTIARNITTPSPDTAVWLCGLLRTPHTDAAMRLAELLKGVNVSPFAADLERIVVARLRAAADSGEDSNLSRELLELLIHLDDHVPVDEPTVLVVYDTVRARLPLDLNQLSTGNTSDHSAAFRDLTTLSGTLMARHLSGEQVRGLFTGLLRSLDPAHLGKKIGSTARALVRSMAGRDPQALPWLEEVFGLPDLALDVRKAIADTVLALDGTAPDGCAARLRNHPACPPEVAALIVARTPS